jgi:hypothetical protein
MRGAYKKFSNTLFREHDSKARDKAIEFFANNGLVAKPNTNDFGVDLLIEDETGATLYFAEVEVKNNWQSGEFPFSTLNIPERKGKYATMYKNRMFWLVFNKDVTKMLLVTTEAMRHAKLVEVGNKFIADGELFYQVPVEKCELYE